MILSVNELLAYTKESKVERILWIDESGQKLYVIDIHSENAWPVIKTSQEISEAHENGDVSILVDDPYLIIIDENAIPEKHKQYRDQAWGWIASLVSHEPGIFREHIRGKMVQEAKAEHGITHKTVYKHLRRYWQRGKCKNALLPDYRNSGGAGKDKAALEKKRGRPRKYAEHTGVNVDEEMKKVFHVAIENYYLNQKGISLQAAYQAMIRRFFAENAVIDEHGNTISRLADSASLPTLRQFRYWYQKEYDIKQEVTARKGRKAFDKDHRAILGSSTAEVIGPGSRYQIDATIADIYLVSRYDRSKIVGRPVLYTVIDVFSRMIVGIYVGFEGPSWVSAMMALANAATNKAEFCRQYGIEIAEEDWPCHHVPDAILGDRGEMEGAPIETLINAFGVRAENTSPYRADWKGIVERRFRTIQAQFKPFVPGYVAPDFQQRGAKDYRLDATLDIHEFTRLIIHCVLHHNNEHWVTGYEKDEFMVSDEVDPIPLHLWNWGIANKTGKLRSYPADIVRFNLLPTAEATVTPQGIRFKHCFYSCREAIQEHWFEKARQGTWKVKVSYDPRNMDEIYLRKDRNAFEYITCSMTEKSRLYLGKTLWEIEQLVSHDRARKETYSAELLESRLNLDAVFEQTVKEAAEKTKAQQDPQASKASRVAAIRDNRQLEKGAARPIEAFNMAKAPEEEIDRQTSAPMPAREDDYSYPNMIDRLRQKRREKKNGKA